MKQEAGGKGKRKILGDIFPKFRISMIDNGRIKRARIEGTKKLLLCLEKEVKISLGEETLILHGEGLACVSYSDGAVEVSGKIGELSFLETRKNAEGR